MREPTRRMPGRTPFRYVSAGCSHAGTVRRDNQDAYLDRAEIGLWVVADGAGGHRSGQYASHLIIDTLADIAPPVSAAGFLAQVDRSLRDANRTLRAMAASEGPNQIIASTVVALLIFGMHFACVWAGDSRLYRLRNRELRQVTHDHTQVQELVDAGLLDPVGADHLPQANVITHAVGAHDGLVLDQLQDAVRPGDVFLLCTDGLTKVLTDDEIAGSLIRRTTREAPRTLVDATLKRGAFDNVTTVVVMCQPAETS